MLAQDEVDLKVKDELQRTAFDVGSFTRRFGNDFFAPRKKREPKYKKTHGMSLLIYAINGDEPSMKS
ncbi:hypothetical protein [Leptospira alexanderi]|uniref:hypothetical protein n=1 Tax=Leptospira alexanderi TaxID=100053 RepID=UPI001FD34DE5|nr:hypothetical protein [Leptospira alexanderi]